MIRATNSEISREYVGGLPVLRIEFSIDNDPDWKLKLAFGQESDEQQAIDSSLDDDIYAYIPDYLFETGRTAKEIISFIEYYID